MRSPVEDWEVCLSPLPRDTKGFIPPSKRWFSRQISEASGWPPENRYAKVVALLLSHGADPSLRAPTTRRAEADSQPEVLSGSERLYPKRFL